MMTLAKAKKLIKIARESITSFYKGKEPTISEELKKEFSKKQGAFISLYVKGELKGCIGYPRPIKSLWKTVIEVARSAAFEDPRFDPLQEKELKDLEIEISVLTEPEVIKVKKPEDYPSKIKIGKDGLMVKDEFGSGLLLPQVATEWGWDSKKFLDETCRKAGLSPDCWNNMKRNVYKFQAQVYREEKGKIVAKKVY